MSFLKELSEVQREAAQTLNGPVMIIAGAGSGKTRVLTYRIAHLMSCGVPPYEILALTFTNKAANEMKERIRRLVGEKAQDLWMGTFHSMFARILRREAVHLGYTQAFTIYDTEDSLGVIKRSMESLSISTQIVNPQAVRSRISNAKNQMVPPAEYASIASDLMDQQVAKIYAEYERRLRRSNAMDFDDLLLRPLELFERHPDILTKYQHRFKFFLVDEFQDTNRAQYAVTRILASRFRNICVVGDDAQSIYAFRGADIRNILDFAKDYSDCKTFRLEENYRSTKRILAAADRLIGYNVDRLKKTLWTRNTEGEMITRFSCADDRDEAQHIVHAIGEEVRSRGVDLKDIAVLYRTNAQSRALEDALRRSGIPYEIVGGVRFYERKEIKDVLAYLRLLVNEGDDESLQRVINYPTRGLGDVSLEHLRTVAEKKNLPLFKALPLMRDHPSVTDRARRSFVEFHTLIEKYRSLRSGMSLSEVTRALVDELGVLRHYKEEGTPESIARWENVQELLSAITEFADSREDATLESFLEEVALVADIDIWEGIKNVVTLMTLHSSKGLEFPVVFITGLEEGLLPFYSSTLDRTALEEERRLAYVGMTRAKTKLYLTHAKMRYRFGEPSYQTASQFLTEIGDDHVEVLESRTGFRRSTLDSWGNGRSRASKAASWKAESVSDGFQPDPFPDYESESQEVIEIKRGSLVVHEVFGKGKVIEVSGGGEMRKASVRFESVGVKNLVLKFAKLRPV
jgi:DNA helicase-2/ATP-dependent DNA helicase PcrA